MGNTEHESLGARFLHWTQRRLLLLLLATYALGALWPGPGVALRGVRVGRIDAWGDAGNVTAPMLMLGALLVVAGLGARFDALKWLLRSPGLVLAGLAANTLYPIAFTLLAAAVLVGWHDVDEAQSILVALAMIGAMPIAGASTTWSQNAEGNLALSLGLVWVSTLVSPLLTPIGLHAVGYVTKGDYSEDLHELASGGSSAFIVLAVVVPSVTGIALRAIIAKSWLTRLMPYLRIASLSNLLVLNYSNASAALPQALRAPDWDFFALVFVIAAVMCAGAFVVGWHLPRLFHASHVDRVAMTFGIGMNNNGTGLVLASTALADHGLVLLPIICYNLVQQVIAGSVDARLHSGGSGVPRLDGAGAG